MNNPCINCPRKVEDEYGLFCDLACGKHTAFLNHQLGVKEVVEWMRTHCSIIDGKRILSEDDWQSFVKEKGLGQNFIDY